MTGIIGGGAAGCFAAAFCAQNGEKTVLIEGNEKLLKKVYITGKGRCNITNDCEPDDFFKNVVTNPKFLYSAVRQFSPRDAMILFEESGCPLKTERGGRVFPQSDKSSDILKAINKLLTQNRVEIKLDTYCKDVKIEGGKFRVVTDKGVFVFDRIVLCGGGISYKSTGSTGAMFETAKRLGHTVMPLYGALSGLKTSPCFKELAGLTLKNVKLSAVSDGKTVFSEIGEMLFTHEGVSGPLILSASSYINKIKNRTLSIDFKPALSYEQLDARILRDFSEGLNRTFKNSMYGLLPKSLADVFVVETGIAFDKQVNSITAKERKLIAERLKNFVLNVTGLEDIDRAIITSGGVSVSEINPSTMESKIIKGLYFAGEMIDVDALTGGFNLQIAMSTGRLAGISAAKAQ